MGCVTNYNRVEKLDRLELYKLKMQDVLVRKGLPGSGGTGKELVESVDAILGPHRGDRRRKEERDPRIEPEEYLYLEMCEGKLEELLAEECIICGDIGVEKLDVPFDSADEFAWAL